MSNKMNVEGTVPMNKDKKSYALRLKPELAEWIEENTTGSQNSVINFLVNVGINQVQNVLKLDSMYVSIDDDEVR